MKFQPASLWGLLTLVLCTYPSCAQNFRLPTHIRPLEYDVRILPWLDDLDFTFDGWVTIRFAVDESANNITLHNKFLAVDEDLVRLLSPSGEEVRVIGHEYDWDFTDFQIIRLYDDLVPTLTDEYYELYIPYHGLMNQAPPTVGLWYAEDLPGTYIVGTQMQPVYTRMVFPCFDEPSLKATFNITVGRRQTARALSNMPIIDTIPSEEDDRYVFDVFATTPVMSCYLVALSVGDLYRFDVDDGLQSLVVRSRYTESYLFPVTRLPVIMEELVTAVDYPLPLEKLDHLALPQFGGGMENFGLIIYGENYILPADDSDISFPTALLTHETAHMWTGDIVTCAYWDVAWLNEGLTHFFTHWVGSKVEPSTELFTRLATTLAETSMKAEQQLDSRPMAAEVLTPEEIELQFDIDLIYNRGGFIGRMMYMLLGEQVFLRGMNYHVTANEFQPVDENDLWTAMQRAVEESGTLDLLPVADFMQAWTRQAGFPLVTVTRNYGEGTAALNQRRFIYVDGNEHEDDSLWTIPLTWTSSGSADFDDTQPKAFLSSAEDVVELGDVGDDEWLLVNVERAGYFRVNYDQRNWEMILEQLLVDPEVIPVVSRAQLTGDIMLLCGMGLAEPQLCAAWPMYLGQRETHSLVWETAAENFGYLKDHYGSEEVYQTSIATVIRFADARVNWLNARRQDDQLSKTVEVLRSFGEHLMREGSSVDYQSPYYLKWKNFLQQ